MSSDHGDVNMKLLHPKGLSKIYFGHKVTMSVVFGLRLYTVKLLHLQLAVLDGFVLRKKTMENVESYFN